MSIETDLLKGLIGYWKLNDGSGLDAIDSSIYGNDGVLEGSTPTWVPGILNKAVNFPGVNERLDCGNNTPLNNIGHGDFSISFWMKSKDATPLNYGTLFTKHQDNSNRIYFMSNGTDNRLNLYFEKSGVTVFSAFSVDSAPFNAEINHIVLVINRTTNLATVHINNVKDSVEIDISTVSKDASNTGNIAWGAKNNGDSPFEGWEDELRIYNRILIFEEIKYLYNYPTGKQINLIEDLIGYWPLNEGTGLIAKDKSGNGNEGILEGDMFEEDWVPGISRRALNFAGVNQRLDCGNNTPLNDFGNGHFTISFWVKNKNAIPLAYSSLFSKREVVNNRIFIDSELNTDKLRFGMNTPAGNNSGTFAATPLDGVIHHIIVEVNRTTDLVSIYVDMVKDPIEIDISAAPVDCSNAGDIAWGAINDGTYPFKGWEDELRIYNRLLNLDEKEYLYKNPKGEISIEGTMIEYALEDEDEEQYELSGVSIISPAKKSITFLNDRFDFDSKIIENSSLPGSVKLGKTRLKSSEIIMVLSRAHNNSDDFKEAENELIMWLNKAVRLIDFTNYRTISICIGNVTINYDPGSHKLSSDNEFSLKLIKPYWESIPKKVEIDSLIIDINSITINNEGVLIVPPIITFEAIIAVAQIQMYIDETKEGIQINDALFGTIGYQTLIIDCKNGTVKIGDLDRTNNILTGTGYFQLPIDVSILKIIPTAACDITIEWNERFYL